MAEATLNAETVTKAPKDKNCPYCGQAFTSSSLGRHLDLYIKEKNPKAPDGIHNVDEIRKIRGSITRRHHKGSRRASSDPAASHNGSRRSPEASDAESPAAKSPGMTTDTQSAADLTKGLASFTAPWETTGVINNIPEAEAGGGSADAVRRANLQRAHNRQMMKSSFDVKQKVQDALDRARAAEQQVNVHSMPFDFDPLSLDFPALCLQCLEPPPTLFSSTQHPTSTSWSIAPPGEKQDQALLAYFQEEFRKWKITCSAATTAIMEELTYPPSQTATFQENTRDSVEKAERAAEKLERQVTEHLRSAFSVWQQLSPQRRQELWILELARSVGRKQKEVDKLKETQHSLEQENTNLKSQIDHLNRLQQPREFKIANPMTWSMSQKMIQLSAEAGVSGRRVVGFNMEDRHSDLNTVVSTAIDRWKSVIVSSRATSGMTSQRPLDQSSASAQMPTTTTQPPTPTGQQTHLHQSSPSISTFSQPPFLRTTSRSPVVPTIIATSEAKTSIAGTPSGQSADDSDQDSDPDAEEGEDEDADADADAEDDVEMGGGAGYLSAAHTPVPQSTPQMAQNQIPQNPILQDQQPYATQQMPVEPRQSPYPQTSPGGGSYTGQAAGILPSQQLQLGQQAFGQHYRVNQAHGGGMNMTWDNH
ncbi:hypothetical protein J7T55_014877 [Diaporthe amygdali]|uniref:uncharacterized protein n=1 Tax=Phomopsis amygdali TaxID=1214568 RepID=UPI0022FF08D6|nr:uncharacterized protein J7T55_014877 [Diaporthe amygdali]KAJ0110074.1 hypothetical protein J7T55_014877 [Diaporthe amygdali]